MHPLQPLVILTLLICTTFSSPVPGEKQGRSFTVPRVRRSDFVPDGPAALKRAYAKFGIVPSPIDFGQFNFDPLPPGANRQAVSKATQPDENGAVANAPTQNDVQYLSPVTIGGQEFVMNFDTGSADLWVFNTQLPPEVQTDHAIFDPAKSQTFAPLEGTTFNITYGDQSFARGTVGTDTVDIGGATVEQQAIGLPQEVSASFATDPDSDGLVGLSFSTINTMQPQQQKTFFDNIAGDLQEPVFTAQLRPGEPGTYEFGAVDQSKFVGDLVDVPIDASNGFWEFQSSMFMVNEDGDIQTVTQGVPSAIADTGTTLMLVNDEIAAAYYEQTSGAELSQQAGGFIFPCDTQLPDLFVSIGDTHLVRIPGSLNNFAPVGTDTATGTELCFGGVQPNQGAGLQVWGDIFFKSVFAVFDQRGPTLRLGAHAPPPQG